MGLEKRRRLAIEAQALHTFHAVGLTFQKAAIVIVSLADLLDDPDAVSPEERTRIASQARDVAAEVGSSLDVYFLHTGQRP